MEELEEMEREMAAMNRRIGEFVRHALLMAGRM
jgi:hypothetical protein